MLGSGNPTPFDIGAFMVLSCMAVLLLLGVMLDEDCLAGKGDLLRRSMIILSTMLFVLVLVVYPTTNGMVGAGRLMTLWPAFLLNLILFLIWSWRSGKF